MVYGGIIRKKTCGGQILTDLISKQYAGKLSTFHVTIMDYKLQDKINQEYKQLIE